MFRKIEKTIFAFLFLLTTALVRRGIDAPDNIVNRWAINGGIQLEQSTGLRNRGTDSNSNGRIDDSEQMLIAPIATAAARAMEILLTQGAPATACADNGF